GDPVNPLNGNLTYDETDITLPNFGVPVTFSRHYDSLSDLDNGLGVGWSYTYGDYLTFENIQDRDPDTGQVPDSSHKFSAIVWHAGDGATNNFKIEANNTFRSTGALFGTLARPGGGNVYTYNDKAGTSYRFEIPIDGD